MMVEFLPKYVAVK